MKLQLGHKVFLTVLFTSLIVIVSMVFIMKYCASRNFTEYWTKMDMKKLGELSDALSVEYKENHGWSHLIDNFEPWVHAMESRDPGDDFRPPEMPPPPGPEHAPQHPEPPGFRERGDGFRERGDDFPPHSVHVRLFDPRSRTSKITLFDTEKHPLAGNAVTTDDNLLKPVLVDGKNVGWIGIKRMERFTDPLDIEFLRRQSQALYLTGTVALLLAALVSMIVSRHLLSPVKKLAEGTRALTSRRFDIRINVNSDDELGQLASDFNQMAQALERYESMRRQWISDISHELRTPLAILRGEIEAMQDGVRLMTPKSLDSLHSEVLLLGKIVQDLHELSILESHALTLERKPVHPLVVLEQTVRSFETRFSEQGDQVEWYGNGKEDIVISGDASRLKQLFTNILENTLRYANSPGILTIRHSISGQKLNLDFEDSGPGVPEESLERLFDRLYRVDAARSRAQGGSGLGLAICKTIVESHDGEITASNAPSGGLGIRIVFPLSG